MRHKRQPSTHGSNGQGTNGRFLPGNKLGRGNPLAGRAAQIRAGLMQACTPERMRKAAERLMSQAEAGDRQAFAELCDRTIGKATNQDVVDRLERLESALESLAQGGVPAESQAEMGFADSAEGTNGDGHSSCGAPTRQVHRANS
jgi:hypothetical protein